LKVSWEGVADYCTAAKLDEIFKQFGIVINIIKSKRKGSAIVEMASKEATVSLVSPSFLSWKIFHLN
jgi:DnaJ family protein C protein 17